VSTGSFSPPVLYFLFSKRENIEGTVIITMNNNELTIVSKQEVLGKDFIVYGSIDEPLFLAKDIAEFIDYDRSSINKMVAKVDDDNKQKKYIYTDGGNQLLWFVNSRGFISIVQYSRKISIQNKLSIASSLGFSNTIVLSSCKEFEFIDMLLSILEPFNFITICQYPILGMNIDLYIKNLNIAVEYDERNHKYYSFHTQEERQTRIENKLGCTFVRVSDSNSNEYNVGIVMKHILDKQSKGGKYNE
jgi:hypothetical protein